MADPKKSPADMSFREWHEYYSRKYASMFKAMADAEGTKP